MDDLSVSAYHDVRVYHGAEFQTFSSRQVVTCCDDGRLAHVADWLLRTRKRQSARVVPISIDALLPEPASIPLS